MTRRHLAIAAALVGIAIIGAATLAAQNPAAAGRGPVTAQSAAPIDLTGYWVSLVTEDWRFRMVTPTKGDYWGVPMNAASRKVADAWDPKADEAAGNQCKSYGAPIFMRLASRFRFTWQDDETLKLESDAGTQTRLLHFQPSSARGPASWQGNSTATWERPGGGRGAPGPGAAGSTGWLKVVTNNLKAGYLRKNGVPYSENAVVTENFDIAPAANGVPAFLVVTTTIEDPMYLNQPYLITSQFKKVDATGWDPTPCSATW